MYRAQSRKEIQRGAWSEMLFRFLLRVGSQNASGGQAIYWITRFRRSSPETAGLKPPGT